MKKIIPVCVLAILGAASILFTAPGSVSACAPAPDGIPTECEQTPPCTTCNGGKNTVKKKITNNTAGAAAQTDQAQQQTQLNQQVGGSVNNTQTEATQAPNLPQAGNGIAAQSSVSIQCGGFIVQTQSILGTVTTSTGGAINLGNFGIGFGTQSASIPLGEKGVEAALAHMQAAAALAQGLAQPDAAAQAQGLARLDLKSLAALAASCQPVVLQPPGNTPVVPGNGGSVPEKPGKTNG